MSSRAVQGLSYLRTLAPWKGKGTFSLRPVRRVLERLGNPQDAIPYLHVGGTNGKGSVSVAVASILGQSGYRVGLNISPHLIRMNERILIDGMECTDDFLGEFALEVRNAATRTVENLSFHEAVTAVAFLGFRELGLDWGVMEVGLGGRLDSSNVIRRPVVTSTVTIDFDHQEILGPTLEHIAREKAGIVKQGCPHVIGRLSDGAARVIREQCRTLSSPLREFGVDFGARFSRSNEGERFEYWDKNSSGVFAPRFTTQLALPGQHQAHNMAVATAMGLQAGLSEKACIAGIQGLFWPCRLENVTISGHRLVFDAGHNPAGLKALTSFLDSNGWHKVDAIFGVLETKEWREMLLTLAPFIRTWRLLEPSHSRALSCADINDHLRVSCPGVRVVSYGDNYEQCLRESLGEEGTTVVAGSMYMVGRVRGMVGEFPRPYWTRG